MKLTNWFRKLLVRPSPLEKSYGELLRNIAKLSPDWAVSGVSEDQDIYQNNFAMRDRSRDLHKFNPYFVAYDDEVRANVHGPKGIACRMKIKETEDRVVYSAEEKAALLSMQARWDRVREYVALKTGKPSLRARSFLHEDAARGVAKVQVGELDVFANQLIERKWKEWQRKENCTVTGRLTYNESRQLRLHSCIRDGGHFIRLVRDGKYKPFGFKIQHINDDWVDYYLNVNEPGKPEIRLGIEYVDGEAVAFHVIERSARDWQYSRPTLGGRGPASKHIRIKADEMIHYARFAVDCDTTRPAPWGASVFANTRQLAKYTEAAVVSARVGACSNVFFEAALGGPDGMSAAEVDPTQLNKLIMEMTPGGMRGLPTGVTAKVINPNNPNANHGQFRSDSVKEFCAGFPGACYSVIANDYASINFSAGKLDRLTITGAWMMLQEFDIEAAERRIFEEWLFMALTTGAIPLPLKKFEKFNAPVFTGRRWSPVDEGKEQTAFALALANKITSLQRIHDSQGTDLEEILFEIAEAKMMMEDFGIDSGTTQGPIAEEEPEPASQEPSANGNGKAHDVNRMALA